MTLNHKQHLGLGRKMIPGHKFLRVICWLGLLLTSIQVVSADPVGTVIFTKGVATAQAPGQGERLLAKGTPIEVKDLITTGPKSFILIQFIDGTKLTLRPATQFSVDEYAHGEGVEKAKVNLLKGGLRALSGAIPKRSPGAFEVKTLEATLGVRGTKFDARRCGTECAEEEKLARKKNPPTARSLVVARVLSQQGSLTAISSAGISRKLSEGGPVYSGDTLQTDKDSHSILVFRDDTRLTIQPDTVFKVESFPSPASEDQDGKIILDLVTGGLRTLTGDIAKINPDNFVLKTPAASVSGNNAGFDIHHHNPTYVVVWLGSVVFEKDGKTLQGLTGQVLELLSDDQEPRLVQQVPVVFLGPSPDTIKVDLQDMFDVVDLGEVPPGFYSLVWDGHVVAEKNPIKHLGGMEALFADQTRLLRIEVQPFQEYDPVPAPWDDNLDLRFLNFVADGMVYIQSCLVP